MNQQALIYLGYAMAALGTIATVANAASLLVPKDSTLGLWLAWFASMPLKHAPKKGASKATKAATVTAVSLLLLSLSGCAGTFEEARIAQSGALQASPVRVSSDRCVTLSEREYWFGVSSVSYGSAGVGSVITAIPVSGKYETALVIAGASASAISVVTGIASQRAGATYVAEGCAK
jgi:hypothetical protein